MRRLVFLFLIVISGAAFTGAANAQNIPDIVLAKDLLLPCQEADNDPRDGFISELECISFMRGFLAGLEQQDGDTTLCLPEANRGDAVRRAFVSWVHSGYTKHSKMPVGEALHEALFTNFACK